MNKKYIALLLIVLTVLFAGCGKGSQEATAAPTQPQQETEAPVETTVPATTPGLEENIIDMMPTETVPETVLETVPATQPSKNGPSGTGPDMPDAPDKKPQPSQKPEATQPETVPETEPETQPPETTPPAKDRSEYEKFQNMAPSAQQEYMNSFDSIDAFFNWYNAAREEHEKLFPDIEIGDGVVDMDEIIGGNG